MVVANSILALPCSNFVIKLLLLNLTFRPVILLDEY